MNIQYRVIAIIVLITSVWSQAPARCQAEKNPKVQLRVVNGRPTVLENGRPVMMAAYDNSIMRPDVWKQWTDHFIKSGIKVFHVTPARYKGVYGQSFFWT